MPCLKTLIEESTEGKKTAQTHCDAAPGGGWAGEKVGFGSQPAPQRARSQPRPRCPRHPRYFPRCSAQRSCGGARTDPAGGGGRRCPCPSELPLSHGVPAPRPARCSRGGTAGALGAAGPARGMPPAARREIPAGALPKPRQLLPRGAARPGGSVRPSTHPRPRPRSRAPGPTLSPGSGAAAPPGIPERGMEPGAARCGGRSAEPAPRASGAGRARSPRSAPRRGGAAGGAKMEEARPGPRPAPRGSGARGALCRAAPGQGPALRAEGSREVAPARSAGSGGSTGCVKHAPALQN